MTAACSSRRVCEACAGELVCVEQERHLTHAFECVGACAEPFLLLDRFGAADKLSANLPTSCRLVGRNQRVAPRFFGGSNVGA